MRNHGAKFCHLVYFIHALASEEVQSVQVCLIVWERYGVVGLLHGDHGLKEVTLAFLYVLTHGVEVCGQIHAGREDTFVIFALRLAIELLPPFADVVQFGVIVHQHLNLLALLAIEVVTCSSILSGWILLQWRVDTAYLHHTFCTVDERLDIQSSTCDRQQSYRRQYREASADIIFDNISLVALLGSQGAQCATFSIGDTNDELLSSLFALLLFELGLQQTERQCWLSGSTRFGDTDDTELLILQQLLQFV